MNIKRIAFLILPLIFTAQSCNLLGPPAPGGARGVFRSMDSGDTWETGKAADESLNLADVPVNRLFIEAAKPNNIIASGTLGGAVASADYGRTWVRLLPGFAVNDAFINPYREQEIFLAGSRNKLAVILKSSNRGAAWVQVYNEPQGEISVTGLAFDRVNPSVMYAGLSSGSLLQSRDSGDTWKALHDFDSRVVRLLSGRGILYVLTTSSLNRSLDDGKTWVNIPVTVPGENIGSFNTLYMDNADNSLLLIGASTGLYRSTDAGVNWTKFALPATPDVSNVTAVNVNPAKRAEIFAAIRATIYKSLDNGVTWKTSKLPTAKAIFDIAIDPMEPNRVYAGLK